MASAPASFSSIRLSEITDTADAGSVLPPWLPFTLASRALVSRTAKWLVGEEGFEPPLAGSEPDILPLDDSPSSGSARTRTGN